MPAVHILFLLLSFSARIRRLNLSPVDRAQVDGPLDRVQSSLARPITRYDDNVQFRIERLASFWISGKY